MIYVGTSGWQYDSWKKRFYPPELPKVRWLPFFAERFGTVEVNNTFYRLPKPEAFDKWRREVPDGFVVTVKASRFITHIKRLKEAGPALEMFLERARRLGERLGPVLFQLPPSFAANLPRLQEFMALVPRDIRAAWEFRHPTWDSEEVRRMLHDAQAALVLADRPGWKVPLHVTGGWSYVRFHQGRRTHPGYTRHKLRTWAQRIASLPARDVYVYFNNDPLGAAVRDARSLIQMLRELGAEVPGP